MKNFSTKEEALGYCFDIISRRMVSSFELKKNFMTGVLPKLL